MTTPIKLACDADYKFEYSSLANVNTSNLEVVERALRSGCGVIKAIVHAADGSKLEFEPSRRVRRTGNCMSVAREATAYSLRDIGGIWRDGRELKGVVAIGFSGGKNKLILLDRSNRRLQGMEQAIEVVTITLVQLSSVPVPQSRV